MRARWMLSSAPASSGSNRILRDYPVIFPNEAICRLWGEVTAHAALAGSPMPGTDAWNAATALYLEVPLVTHNPRNYQGAPDLTIITESRTP